MFGIYLSILATKFFLEYLHKLTIIRLAARNLKQYPLGILAILQIYILDSRDAEIFTCSLAKRKALNDLQS